MSKKQQRVENPRYFRVQKITGVRWLKRERSSRCNMNAYNLREESRFKGIEPFENRLWLSSPTMHGEELQYITEAYESNWMSTVGENIDRLERSEERRVGKECRL